MFGVMKSLILTAFIVICLQTQWQGRTLEDHTVAWLGHSAFGQQIHGVVRSLIRLFDVAIEQGGRTLAGSGGTFIDASPGERKIQIERSAAYLSEKVDSALTATEEVLESTADSLAADDED